MKFRDLILDLADVVGRHHLPVVEDSHEIGDFLGNDAIHYALVKKLIRSVYRANRCGHLNAEISANPTFDAIGKIRGELVRSADTDLDAIRLLDQIGDYVSRILASTDAGSGVEVDRVECVSGKNEDLEDTGPAMAPRDGKKSQTAAVHLINTRTHYGNDR